jgi:hypothetical protein
LHLVALFYKKHYDNGYTFLKHKKKAQMQNSQIAKDLQQKSIGELNANWRLEKEKEQKKSRKNLIKLTISL